jgi:hypothetical protein
MGIEVDGGPAIPRPNDPANESLPSRRISSVGARHRLEAELRSIAVDLLGPNEADEFSPTCADWVGRTTGAAVSRVCDPALETLVQALDSLLADAPQDVARRLRQARSRQETGFA